MHSNSRFFSPDCDVIPENPTFMLTYDESNVLYNAVAAPSGQKLPRTVANLECAAGWFLPYSITGSLTPVTSQSYTCAGGSFNAGSPVCRLGIVFFFVFFFYCWFLHFSLITNMEFAVFLTKTGYKTPIY